MPRGPLPEQPESPAGSEPNTVDGAWPLSLTVALGVQVLVVLHFLALPLVGGFALASACILAIVAATLAAHGARQLNGRVRETVRAVDHAHGQRRRQDDQLERQKALIQEVIDTIPYPIWVRDQDGRYRVCNRITAELYGVDPASMIGKTDAELGVPAEIWEPWQEADRRLLRENPERVYPEIEITWPNGETSWQKLVKRRLPGDGERSSWILGVAFDITELKRSQEEIRRARDDAEAGARAKSGFLATMSHEIRTPMNAIVGLNDLLGSSSLDEEQSEWVDGIRASSAILLTMLNDILDFSKLEATRVRPVPEPFAVAEFADVMRRIFRYRAAQGEVTFDAQIKPATPSILIADHRRLRQIVVNLLSNALKFTSHGTVRLTLSFEMDPVSGAGEAVSSGSGVLQVAVSDEGLGMDQETIDHIFEPFYQADSSLRREFDGTGLGLAITRRLVEGLGGTIRVDSQQGSGSIFTVSLPCRMAGDDVIPVEIGTHDPFLRFRRQDTPADPVFRDVPEARKRRILVVEDNPTNRQVTELLLGKLGFDANSVVDGEQAVEAVRKRRFDIILMDLMMPGMDGFETTAEIQRQLPAQDRPRIVALTANATLEDRDRCLRHGMDDYLPKPVTAATLGEVLKRNLPAPLPEGGEGSQEKPHLDLLEGRNRRLQQLVESFQQYAPEGVDCRTLANLILDNDFNLSDVEAIIRLFLKESERIRDELAEALRLENGERLRFLAHTLKGNARSIGANRVATLAESLEASLPGDKAQSLLEQISAAEEEIQAPLEQLLDRLSEENAKRNDST